MKLSIVITTYNRAPVLKGLLLSLEKQTDSYFQVVVAIDGSTDNTEEVLAELETNYDLKWINTHCEEYGLAVARNQGVLASDGEAVVILDDDSFPDVGFVASHKSSVKKHVITGGPRNPANTDDKKMLWKMEELAKLPVTVPMTILQLRQDWPNAYLIENNICLYKKDWLELGLFSERIKKYGFIGQEFFARAEYFGFTYQYNHKAKVMHHGQLEGDNGLTRKTKTRQSRISRALRTSLMKPCHYNAQVEWAKSFNKGQPDNSILLPFALQAYVMFPFRYLRQSLVLTKKKLKASLLSKTII